MPTTSVPTDIAALVTAFFDTRYARRDDAAHLATYAPEAMLVLGDRALQRAEADPVEVLAAWAAVSDREPAFVNPTVTAWREDGVATVSLTEKHTGDRVTAWVGVVETGGTRQVAWATLAEGEAPAYAQAAFQALAELASLKAMAASGPLTGLIESAWARRRWLPKQRLLALPETHFSCMGTGSCCSHELTIGLDDGARRFVEAVDWSAVAPELPEGPYMEALPAEATAVVSFRHKLARDERGRCRFLTEDNRCSIHALAGRAVFKPCHVFPYRFAWSPDGICVTTNHMCPTARFAKGQPLSAQEGDLRSRLAVADMLKVDAYYVRPAQQVPWETFRTLEGQLLELLNGEAPIKQKLWGALRWLQERLDDPEAGVDPAWFEQDIPRLGLIQRLSVARFGALFDPCFKDLKGVEAGPDSLPDVEAELTRFFRSLLFSKVTTYPYGIVAGLNYLALVYHVLERQVDRSAKKGISEAFWREFYAVITSGTFFPILAACHRTPATMLARVAGTPNFGLNLLRL
jgi:hypothetical protein